MKKGALSWGLFLAGLGGLVWLWWRNRTPGTSTPATGSLPNFGGQVGSNISEDLSGDVIASSLAFAQKQIDKSRCYRLVDPGIFSGTGLALWVPSGEGRDSTAGVLLPMGQLPKNACGYT